MFHLLYTVKISKVVWFVGCYHTDHKKGVEGLYNGYQMK